MRVLMLLFLLCAPLCAQDAARAPKTKFLPSRDMWTVNQPADKQGQNRLGVCNGMLQSSLAYWEVVRKDQGSAAPAERSLARVSTSMVKEYGQNFVENTVEELHEMVGKHANSWSGGTTQATTADEAVKALDSKDASPFRLKLTEGTRDHLVAAYDYRRSGDKIIFNIADPNFPAGHPNADSRELVYDTRTRRYEPYQNADGSTFSGVGHYKYPVSQFLKKDLAIRMGEAELFGRLPDPYIRKIPEPPKGAGIDGIKVPSPVTVTVDPGVGGVLITFDPAIYDGLLTEQELADLVARVRQFAASGNTGTLFISPKPVTEELRLVSLNSVLAEGSKTLGSLTRVRGFVLSENGELVIAGITEPNQAPISLDVLTVALRHFYKASNRPYISLDPQATDFSAPHKARFGDMDAELEDTEFTQAMLAADYLMKRIELGDVDPGIEGFKSWYVLVTEAGKSARESIDRSWLTPHASPIPDVYEHRSGSALALMFDSRVQVLTEELKLSGEGLVGKGSAGEFSMRAANMLTDYYAHLELKYSEFHRLHQVFDLCKLCGLLRARSIKCASLDTLAARTPARVVVKRSYEAIGPKLVAGNTMSVTGGC